ncbi:MAG: MFS transporter [Anaerolineae bacterium]
MIKNLLLISQLYSLSRLKRLRSIFAASGRPAGARAEETRPFRVGILIGLMVPMIMMSLNFSMFRVALPIIRDDFGIQADIAAWVMTVYTLPFMIFMPLYGRLGDAFGRRRLYLIGITVFLTGTVIAVLAPNLGWLMAGRAVQGLGTSSFVPLSMAIISQRFPPGERGQALGTWNSVMPFMGMISPVLGGLLIDHLGWRTIFGPVLVAGLVGFLTLRGRVPPTPGVERDQAAFLRSFDWGGVALLGLTVTSLLFYASSRPITGVAALQDWRLLGLTLLLLGGFVYWERRRARPFVDLSILTNKIFRVASLSAGVRMFAMSGIGFLIPLYLADVHALNAAATGLLLMVHAGALFATLRLGGLLADRWDGRWLVVLSLSSQAAMMVYLGLLPATAPLWAVAAGVVAHGLGAGFSLATLHRAAMARIPEEQSGMAAGLYSMVRFAGTVFGTALGGVILQSGLSRGALPIQAYQTVFLFIAGVALLGALTGFGLQEPGGSG